MKAYTYSDVLIEPRYSEILSRQVDIDLSTRLGNHELNLPVLSANMKDITGPKMTSELIKHGGKGILHRFCSVDENLEMFQETILRLEHQKGDKNNIGVSIGVQEEDKKRFDELYKIGARIFCIDVAHGHHILVKNMLNWINRDFGFTGYERSSLTIIAGNIATAEAYIDLTNWGADCAKVGIGPSPVCRTRYNTGVGVPQLYALQQIYEKSIELNNPISIIADGGISHVGDIAKALRYADCVMLGSMISGTSETPGGVFRDENNEFYKVYGGSSSGERKRENRFVEGTVKTSKFRGKVKYILRDIEHGLKSAFSYVGASNHNEYQEKCEFVHLSGGARGESKV